VCTSEFEYHATSDDEVEMSNGDPRSAFDEAAALGDFAVDLLHEREATTDNSASTEAPAAPPLKPWVGSSFPPTNVPPDELYGVRT
jgi:hypothetical protein